MPRLRMVEKEQHGSRAPAGASGPPSRRTRAMKDKTRRDVTPPPQPKRKKRVFLSKDQQALLLVRYMQLPKNKNKKAKALEELCKEFDVYKGYPAELLQRLKEEERLGERDGVGGAPEKMTEEQVELLVNTLETHAYELTYRQLETITGIPKTSIWRFVKETPGWREVRKGTRPRLSEKNMHGRLAWAEKHQHDDWEHRVDIDEKIFYAYSASGTLKLPPGCDKPRTPLQSRRFIPKVMMLAGVGKPNPKLHWDGKLGIWEVGHTRPAKRGDSRTGLKQGDPVFEAASLDGEGFVKMLLDNVFPAIRMKLSKAKRVLIQLDNAGPHKTRSGSIDPRLAKAMKAGKPIIEFADQIAQSPCTNLCDLGFFKSIDSRLPKLRS